MTYVVPDRHDEDHGLLESCVELGESANFGESVAVAESLELVGAELRGDVAAGGDALCGCEHANGFIWCHQTRQKK